VLTRLYNTNKYELAELSCYRFPSIVKKEPWKVYPVVPKSDDPFKKIYDSQKLCEFGQVRFEFAALDFRPDIVIDIRDFWYFSYQNLSPLRKFFHWIIAPTYDSSPQPIDAIRTYKQADSLLFHSEWAKNEFLKYSDGENIRGIVSDAVDLNNFIPLNYNAKNKYGIDSETFIIGSVMRNQQRKLIPETFIVLKKLLDTISTPIYFYLQTTYPENDAWDIPVLLLEYGVQNNVLFSYLCKTCGEFRPSVYQGINRKCPHCGKTSQITSTNHAINQNQLNEIYNLFDVYLQYSSCEGFGIPQVEASAAGVPVVTVDHGAMKEVGSRINADIIPINKTFKEIIGGTNRVYPDNDICYNILKEHITTNRKQLDDNKTNLRSKTKTAYNWDITAKKFEDIIDTTELSDLQGKWSDKHTLPQYIPKTLPTIDSNREFIYYIVDNILCEPRLKRTNFIEEIICNLDSGYTIASNKSSKFTRDHALLTIQNWANNKYGLENIRLNKQSIPQNLHYFLNYS